MTRTVRLRPWQKTALDRFVAHDRPDFLAVATPGAGKTTFALTAARHRLAEVPGRLIVVAPTAHLKHQWAQAASRFALHLDPTWSAADGALAGDMHGIVTTYQQVATSAAALRALSPGAFVVFDELHHAADDRAWGDSVRAAFEPADRRLALSGTPFRSDTRAIPFVDYHLDEARPDFEYGYGDALADRRVVRPVYFPRTGGQMEWSAPDGSEHSATFDDDLDAVRASHRLRTALSLEGEWLPTVLRDAHARLTEVRMVQPDAGGLVIATDQDHARGIAELLRSRFGTRATVVTSDDPRASSHIAMFAAGKEPWLVAVRMVSEGVDIPRLRVGVYATTTSTELFFRQAVGRLVRWTRGVPQQKAWLFIPDDARLRRLAHGIAEQRRHSLQRREREAPLEGLDDAALDAAPPEEEQMSLFAVISAVATDADGHEPAADDDGYDDDDDEGPGFELELAPPPPLAGGVGPVGVGADGAPLTRKEDKKRLRDLNAELARDLVRTTGMTHAQVNRELNRISGITRVTEATVAQLRTRLDKGTRWLNRSA
ncbi:DEAD/DEAH box helicase [Iamia sp. SCSIO 61187]|uniref:DEAD/DEAH box helicase n=1 Tax=Iamia sp. SCSIO 61187 TaxID=2722752 RepID=UPI001C62FA84|nr:DEAD/DEAH box helicase [Iamia sp. SCSIO 61187]QYG92504.1 DEAD/DEAH box helicase [Iamia sp. SCSIO 61187]